MPLRVHAFFDDREPAPAKQPPESKRLPIVGIIAATPPATTASAAFLVPLPFLVLLLPLLLLIVVAAVAALVFYEHPGDQLCRGSSKRGAFGKNRGARAPPPDDCAVAAAGPQDPAKRAHVLSALVFSLWS